MRELTSSVFISPIVFVYKPTNPLSDLIMVSQPLMPSDETIKSGLACQIKISSQINKNLSEEQITSALVTSYKAYRQNLNLKYEQFLGTAHQNIPQILKLDKNLRSVIVSGLSERATKHIKDVESKYWKVSTFFHKVMEFFRGHGFQTQGEYGLQLAASLNNELKALKEKVKGSITHGLGLGMKEKCPAQIMKELKDEINSLSDQDFISLINDVLFVNKNGDTWVSNRKFQFFQNLSQEKFELFCAELEKRKDWFEQMSDILINVPHKTKEERENILKIITESMLQNFLQNKPVFINRKRTPEQEFMFQSLIAKSVQSSHQPYMTIITNERYIQNGNDPFELLQNR